MPLLFEETLIGFVEEKELSTTIKAAAAATGITLLAALIVKSPVGLIVVIPFGLFVLDPLDGLGPVDLGKGDFLFVPNSAGFAFMAGSCWLFFFCIFFGVFKSRAEEAAKEDGSEPSSVSQQGSSEPVDGAGRKLSIGDRVVIRSVESCLTKLTDAERLRLRALVGMERLVVDLDRFGFVWFSFSAADDSADFCLSPKDVARAQ